MSETRIIQFFVKLIDNKTLTLQFPSHQTLTSESIKHKIETLTQIPTQFQTLTLNGKVLSNSIPILSNSLNLSTISLNFSLVGGKGGFGSLLRGAATKAGQKKTNNFDACRDMSGRRLRHVNAEKRLEEWKAEQEERRLEKVAEEYLKKMAKKGKGGKKEEGAEKYVQKYREESARCVEEVEKSVRESVAELMANGKKRKLKEKLKGKEGVDAKKLKVWMGKRKMGESESDSSDDDEESDGSDVENEKSVVIDNGNQSDSSKDGSSGSVSVPQLNDGHHGGGSSDSGSDAEKEAPAGGSSASPSNMGSNVHENGSVAADSSLDAGENTMDDREKLSISVEMVSTSTETLTELDPREADRQGIIVDGQLQSTTVLKEEDGPLMSTDLPEGQGASECKSASGENGTTLSSDVTELSQPLNFDNYNSAAELEVLGMERLKAELQASGLKCGGTLQERAARLFLLKTTPVEKLPKKLLAKK